jgi:ankyrin repeat protein
VTPLHRAAREGHKQTAELLIANGAGVNEKDENGETPLDRAIARKRIEIIDLLRKHGGKTGLWLRAGESIHIAAAAGHIEAVKHFLAAGGDVNAKDKNGWTGLHHAALAGRIEITQLLIAKGVDVNTRNDRRRTPLDYVVNNAVKTNNRDEIIELLRKNGGKTDEELKAEGK